MAPHRLRVAEICRKMVAEKRQEKNAMASGAPASVPLLCVYVYRHMSVKEVYTTLFPLSAVTGCPMSGRIQEYHSNKKKSKDREFT